MTATPRVGIIGGGVMGTTLALRLAQSGAEVTLLERAPSLGGLAGAMDWGGHTVDRFYHVITPADSRMIAMAEELGLGDQLHFRPVGAGFLVDGELHDFNGLGDFLGFKPLTPVQRLRLGWFVAQCQLRSGYSKLEDIPLERWLRRHCGDAVTERIWNPLFDSRYEGRHDELPATFLWSRTRRMSGTRMSGDRRETMGAVEGGHQRLIDAIARRGQEHGVDLALGAQVETLLHDPAAGVTGVRAGGEDLAFDLTIATLQPPALAPALPTALQPLLEPYPKRFLGVVCVILKLRERILPYYATNICDPTPITTVVEAADAVGTEHTGGLRLVYLPKYCDPGSPVQREEDESIYERFISFVEKIAPGFSREQVVDWNVQRARLVEPVHPVGKHPRLAPVWPDVPGLALASNAQVYPRVLSGDSVMTLAEDVAVQAAERLGLMPR